MACAMIAENEITDIFCLVDDLCKYFSSELTLIMNCTPKALV